MQHFLPEKTADDIFSRRIKVFVFKLALILQSATSHLVVLHLLSEVLERQTGSHHLIDAAAKSPPVHRRVVALLLQNLRSHVTCCTSLTTHTHTHTHTHKERRKYEGDFKEIRVFFIFLCLTLTIMAIFSLFSKILWLERRISAHLVSAIFTLMC